MYDLQRILLKGIGLWVALSLSVASASDRDEFKIKREAVFAFSERPSIKRNGDRIEIRFTSKGYCDVTMAVEDGAGKIVRHLGCGVLGKNAPAPFQKNSLRQSVVWDSKDDQGRYIDDMSGHTVRVSLGLKPRFEKTLYWEPKKRWSSHTPLIRATPDGVYVFENGAMPQLRLFSHAGEYVRAIYPFPADKLEEVKGLHWKAFPQDGRRLPYKRGYFQASFLSSGVSSFAGFKGELKDVDEKLRSNHNAILSGVPVFGNKNQCGGPDLCM